MNKSNESLAAQLADINLMTGKDHKLQVCRLESPILPGCRHNTFIIFSEMIQIFPPQAAIGKSLPLTLNLFLPLRPKSSPETKSIPLSAAAHL